MLGGVLRRKVGVVSETVVRVQVICWKVLMWADKSISFLLCYSKWRAEVLYFVATWVLVLI